MKRIRRQPLGAKSLRFLAKRAERVLASEDPQAEARKLWRQQDNQAFDEVRGRLRDMASGRSRCMYTEDSEGTDIDHFWPKSSYPEKAFDWSNYLLACSHCNSNDKRDRFPLDQNGEPLLLNPTAEEPLDHLAFSPSSGKYLPRTRKGRTSIEVYSLNRSTLENGRRDAWSIIEACLIRYDQRLKADQAPEALKIEAAIREMPFAGVFVAFLKIADGPAAGKLVDAEVMRILAERPEIQQWAESDS